MRPASEIQVGIGISESYNSLEAGKEAADKARAQLAGTSSPGWALAFCGGRHDPDAFAAGLREQVGDLPVVGGAAVGTIGNQVSGYTGYEGCVALFPDTLSEPRIFTVNNLNQDEVQAGRRLGEQIRLNCEPGTTILLFYDSIRSSPPPVLNVGSFLMEGLYQGLNGHAVDIVGAGLIGDFQMTSGFVFDGAQARRQSALAVALPARMKSETIIMHGCTPISTFMEITAVDGAVIQSIDGRPALEVILDLVSLQPTPADIETIPLTVTIGKKYGDPFAPFSETAFVNRLIMATDPQVGSVTLFEADFELGDKIQLMARDNQMMLDSVETGCRKMMAALEGRQPLWGLYINCAGRSSAFSGAEVEDARILQAEIGNHFPLLGLYSGVELAPLRGRTRPLDWTGVLTVITLGETS